jgi:glycogen debranching enzyme
VPWFLTLFGRDSIWAARMMLPLGTGLAAGTLRTLARRQGTRVDEHSAEAPGKIMHELRHDDARISESTALPSAYYGTVDATLLWISLLADAWRWGLAESTVASLLPHLHRALYWLEHHGDPDGDGFVEYIDHSGRGLANQGWKDSFNAVRFHDGRLARAPIALCEVQGYAHRAALDAAAILEAFGGGDPDRWRQYAADLSAKFRSRFWTDGALGSYPAMALDADGRKVDSLTSNVGHLLGTGILSADEETTVASLLAAPTLSGAYGLRTMSTLDAGFDPLSYHCGSVWPHDTAIALLGLTSAGADAAPLIQGLLAAAEAFEYRLPELYGGDSRDEVGRPIPYPGACRPQAWSAAAGITVLQATLGLTVDVPRGEVRLGARRTPSTSEIAVRGLTIAEHRVDIAIDRDAHATVSGLPPHLHLTDVGAPQPTPA